MEAALVREELDAPAQGGDGQILIALAAALAAPTALGVEHLRGRDLSGLGVDLGDLLFAGVVGLQGLRLQQQRLGVAGASLQHFGETLAGHSRAGALAAKQTAATLEDGVVVGVVQALACAELTRLGGQAVDLLSDGQRLQAFGALGALLQDVERALQQPEVPAPRQVLGHQRVHVVGAALAHGGGVQQALPRQRDAGVAGDTDVRQLGARDRHGDVLDGA